jgi:hypothetical protein
MLLLLLLFNKDDTLDLKTILLLNQIKNKMAAPKNVKKIVFFAKLLQKSPCFLLDSISKRDGQFVFGYFQILKVIFL